MEFIADENIPYRLIKLLRDENYDIISVCETLKSISDLSIMNISQKQNRIIITQDKDFGELVFRSKICKCAGVILFRLINSSPEDDIKLMYSTITSRTDWLYSFSVITDFHIRMRPLQILK